MIVILDLHGFGQGPAFPHHRAPNRIFSTGPKGSAKSSMDRTVPPAAWMIKAGSRSADIQYFLGTCVLTILPIFFF